MAIRMDCGVCVVRSWRVEDAPSLAIYANNREIWLNLRDQFPHPYGLADAEAYLRLVSERPNETSFAIEVAGQAVGGVSLRPGHDVERCSAEIGYWLGEPFWGRGIMTSAVRTVTEHAFDQLGLTRVFAVPFARNPASSRVLDKAGYEREGLMRRSAIKDGVILDQYLYAKVR